MDACCLSVVVGLCSCLSVESLPVSEINNTGLNLQRDKNETIIIFMIFMNQHSAILRLRSQHSCNRV